MSSCARGWSESNTTYLTFYVFEYDLSTFLNTGFSGCPLASIRIPSTVNYIGHHAFIDCSQLTNVKLREGLEGIDCGAFKDCTSLVSIPSIVKWIGWGAFHGCN